MFCIIQLRMSRDITDILREWEYEPGNQIRIIQADDGREVLQVRQPLGIEQYELDGRPDGKRPFGKRSVLDEYLRRLDNYVETHGGDEGFVITHDDFLLLQSEAIIYYFRYLVLFQIGDFVRTARDTEHNLKICDLVEDFSDNEEDKREMLQYRPYIVRMNAMARAMISLGSGMKSAAKDILESAIESIESMPEIDTPAFQFEKVRSVNYLKSALRQMSEEKESPIAELKRELERAVEEENYEKAAELRDRIKELEEKLNFPPLE